MTELDTGAFVSRARAYGRLEAGVLTTGWVGPEQRAIDAARWCSGLAVLAHAADQRVHTVLYDDGQEQQVLSTFEASDAGDVFMAPDGPSLWVVDRSTQMLHVAECGIDGWRQFPLTDSTPSCFSVNPEYPCTEASSEHLRRLQTLLPATHRRGFVSGRVLRWVTQRDRELVMSEATLPDLHAPGPQLILLRHMYAPTVLYADAAGFRYDLRAAWVEAQCAGFSFLGWTALGFDGQDLALELGCGSRWEGAWLGLRGSWMHEFTRLDAAEGWCLMGAVKMGSLAEVTRSLHLAGPTWMGTHEGRWAWIADTPPGGLVLYEGPAEELVTIIPPEPGPLRVAKPGPPTDTPQPSLRIPDCPREQ